MDNFIKKYEKSAKFLLAKKDAGRDNFFAVRN